MQSTLLDRPETLERARLSRDPHFDGRFYVGVLTTGIYCRPICPATPPRSDNVRFYPTAASAAEAGFRPCLRCRPETAPGTPVWAGTSTTVQRALRLIESGALDSGNLELLAERLGVTSRHLRRLFQQHLGASPTAVANTQRLHFAKRLITDSTMPMSDIAIASGFNSVRRFNDAFKATYKRTPRSLRTRRAADGEAGFTLRVPVRAPFDWSSVLEFFAARAIPHVESVRDDAYRRSVRFGNATGLMETRFDTASSTLVVTLAGLDVANLLPATNRVRAMFDTDAPIADITRLLQADPALASAAKLDPPARVPGAFSGFELAVRAILGQQVSVAAATTLSGRVAERYGDRLSLAPDVTRVFPEAGTLARARFNDMGITGARIATIRSLARAIESGELSLELHDDPVAVRERLLAIPGIGPWTAEYIVMRALKDPDAFPTADLGLLRAFDDVKQRRIKPKELDELSEQWRPWRAYAALSLWAAHSGG